MKNLLTTLVLTLLVITTSTAQESAIENIKLNQVIKDFGRSISTKDSITFNALFFDKDVAFIGMMSQKTERTLQKEYPEFEGLSVSTSSKFIADICKTEKKQTEQFYHIKIDTDGAIASISFYYSYYSGDNMIQWGDEKWNLVKLKEQWLITDVVYSIHFPDIEPFPFTEVEKN